MRSRGGEGKAGCTTTTHTRWGKWTGCWGKRRAAILTSHPNLATSLNIVQQCRGNMRINMSMSMSRSSMHNGPWNSSML